MKASKFSESQIAFVLRQRQEGVLVEEICRKTGISPATYYNWKKKYGGLMPSAGRLVHEPCRRSREMQGLA